MSFRLSLTKSGARRNLFLITALLIDFSASHTFVCFGRNDRAWAMPHLVKMTNRDSGGAWINDNREVKCPYSSSNFTVPPEGMQ